MAGLFSSDTFDVLPDLYPRWEVNANVFQGLADWETGKNTNPKVQKWSYTEVQQQRETWDSFQIVTK